MSTEAPLIRQPALTQDLREWYSTMRNAIQRRLDEFKLIASQDWFYELCFCLCTPQSKALHAEAVVRILREHDFENVDLDPTPILRNPAHYIRFHNVKAKNLRLLRERFPAIRHELEQQRDAVEMRSWLVSNVRGMGMKEASHFLRNTGARELAIIDRHILKHLFNCGVLESSTAPSSIKQYQAIEQRWKAFAHDIRIPIDELDLLFWSFETGEILK